MEEGNRGSDWKAMTPASPHLSRFRDMRGGVCPSDSVCDAFRRRAPSHHGQDSSHPAVRFTVIRQSQPRPGHSFRRPARQGAETFAIILPGPSLVYHPVNLLRGQFYYVVLFFFFFSPFGYSFDRETAGYIGPTGIPKEPGSGRPRWDGDGIDGRDWGSFHEDRGGWCNAGFFPRVSLVFWSRDYLMGTRSAPGPKLEAARYHRRAK